MFIGRNSYNKALTVMKTKEHYHQLTTTRETIRLWTYTSDFRIGKNITSNRLRTINNQISLADLNDSMPTFKVKKKRLFLSLGNSWKMNNQ